MGGNVSTFRRSSSTTLRLQQAGSDGNSSPGPSYMELLKPECLRSAEKKKRKRRPLSPEKKKIYNNYTSSGSGAAAGSGTRLTTLEEWLLSSPGHGMSKPTDTYNMNGGELYVFRPYSRRVHPAASSSSKILPAAHRVDHGHNTALLAGSKAIDSFCLDRLVKNDDDKKADEANLANKFSSIGCRSESGNGHKLKKKVSFRLPEEADIIIFYPSEEIMKTADSDDIDDEDFD